MFDAVEGVHYIVDRYAFLNKVMEDGEHSLRLTDKSTVKDIALAIKLGQAMYHSDRLQQTGKTMRAEAARNFSMIQECNKYLLDDEVRPLYDTRLKMFQETQPENVSKDGTAIVNLSRPFFNLSLLLKGNSINKSKLEERAQQETGYSEAAFTQVANLYQGMPDNDQIKDLFRGALSTKMNYLTALENGAWVLLGRMNGQPNSARQAGVSHSDEYTDAVNQTLQEFMASDVVESIQDHMTCAQIGFVGIKGLLPEASNDAGASVSKTESNALSQVFQMAQKNFEIGAGYVREIAEQKEAVLEQLINLQQVETLSEGHENDTVHDYYLLHSSEGQPPQVMFFLTLNTATGQASIDTETKSMVMLEDLKKEGFKRPSYAITHNPAIDSIVVEVTAAAEGYIEQRNEANRTPSPSAPSFGNG